MLPVLLNGLLRIGGLRYQQHVLLIVDDRGQAFAQKRMIIYTQNTNLGLCRHRVCSLADCDFSLLGFPRYSLDNHPARRPSGRFSKAICPGTNSSTSVPATATQDSQFPANAFRSFLHPGQTPMSLASEVQNMSVYSASVLAYQYAQVARCKFKFDLDLSCVSVSERV